MGNILRNTKFLGKLRGQRFDYDQVVSLNGQATHTPQRVFLFRLFLEETCWAIHLN